MRTSTLISEGCAELHVTEIKSSIIDVDIDWAEQAIILAQFISQPHTPEAMDGITYYEEKFNLSTSDARRATIYFLGSFLVLERAAQRVGVFLSGKLKLNIWKMPVCVNYCVTFTSKPFNYLKILKKIIKNYESSSDCLLFLPES